MANKNRGAALELKEDSGTCELVWFNSQKGYGEVRFVNTENVAVIFASQLPQKILKNVRKHVEDGILLDAFAKISKDKGVFWSGQLVVASSEIPTI